MEIGRFELFDAAGERAAAGRLAEARMDWARCIAQVPGLLAALVDEVEARLALGGSLGELADGLVREHDASEETLEVALARFVSLYREHAGSDAQAVNLLL